MTTDFTVYIEPTKKEIIQRLYQEGHITFNEMWTLLQNEPEVRYIPMPSQVIPAPEQWNPLKHPGTGDPLYPPYTHTAQDPANDNRNTRLHLFPRGGHPPEQSQA